MHRSRLSTLLIDVRADEADSSTAFWSAALGVPTHTPPGEPQFRTLQDCAPGLVVAVQAVEDMPRYHVDIETDDVEAETGRLIGLGATQVARWLECRVLRAPGGHLLCVLPVESAPELFDAQATTWP